MTKTTRTTYRIRERAMRAIETGHEFVYVSPSGARVRIGYVAGGGFIRVDHRDGSAILNTRTEEASLILHQLDQFTAMAEAGERARCCGRVADNDPYAAGRIAGFLQAIAEFEAMLPTIDRDTVPGDRDIARLRALNEAHRALLDLLDETE